MKISRVQYQRSKNIHVVCHDEPITIRGKRYKMLTISCCDLWNLSSPMKLDTKQIYHKQYELMIFHHRDQIGFDDIYSERDSREYKLDVVLQDLRRGVYK